MRERDCVYLTNEREFGRYYLLRKNNAARNKHSYFILNIYFRKQRNVCGFHKRIIESALNGIFKAVKLKWEFIPIIISSNNLDSIS